MLLSSEEKSCQFLAPTPNQTLRGTFWLKVAVNWNWLRSAAIEAQSNAADRNHEEVGVVERGNEKKTSPVAKHLARHVPDVCLISATWLSGRFEFKNCYLTLAPSFLPLTTRPEHSGTATYSEKPIRRVSSINGVIYGKAVLAAKLTKGRSKEGRKLILSWIRLPPRWPIM